MTSGGERAWDVKSLRAQLDALGVPPGAILLVHTSYRAIRPVSGGPATFLDALRQQLGPEGTLVMPSMSSGEELFDPLTTPSVDMGCVAELFWRQPGVLRSTHPGASFAAQGPLAAHICEPQPLEPLHGPQSPVGRVFDLDGHVLLAGVGYDASTSVHLAEEIFGVPYRTGHPCVTGAREDGQLEQQILYEPDHCCRNFERVGERLRTRGEERRGPLGGGTAILFTARHAVEAALELLQDDALAFLCDPSRMCEECDAARASVR